MNPNYSIKKSLNETFNSLKLRYIIANFHTFKSCLRWKDRYDILPPDKLIKNYLFNSSVPSDDSSAIATVEYYRKDNRGRHQARHSLSLQAIPREIRHTIAKEYYNDIDIVNAHPVILQWLCSNIDCPQLDKYIKNREKYLSNIKVDRQTAKDVYLAVTNGGVAAYNLLGDKTTKHLTKYKKEMIDLHTFFASKEYENFNQDDYDNLVKRRKKDKKDYNHKASYMNMILRDWEDKILMEMYKFYGEPDNCVLCFDGLMLPKSISIKERKCEKYVKKQLNICIKLKVKDMNEDLTLPSDKDMKEAMKGNKISLLNNNIVNSTDNLMFYDMNQIIPRLQVENFECKTTKIQDKENKKIYFLTEESQGILIKLINETLIYVKDAGKEYFYVKKNRYDPRTKHTTIDYVKRMAETLYKDNDCIGIYNAQWSRDCKIQKLGPLLRHLTCHIDPKTCKYTILRYSDVTFYPASSDDVDFSRNNIFNMFRGFNLQRLIDEDNKAYEKFEDIEYTYRNSLIYKHINENICDNNIKLISYTHKWIAHMIQKTHKKPEVAFLLYGLGGEGKDRFSAFLGNLIGRDYFIKYNNLAVVNKTFNSINKNKILCVLNEIDDKSSFKNHGSLNDLITKEDELSEPKGIDADNLPCFKRIILNTNYRDTLYMDQAMKRRVILFEVSDKRVDDFEFFSKLSDEIVDGEFLKIAFSYYAKMSIRGFNPRIIPMTKYKENQIELNIRGSYKFMRQLYKLDDISEDGYLSRRLYNHTIDLSEKEIEKNKDEETNIMLCTQHSYHFKIKDLHEIYKKWCEEEDEKPMKRSVFKQDLITLKLGDGRTKFNNKCIIYNKEDKGEKNQIRGYNINNKKLKEELQKVLRYKL